MRGGARVFLILFAATVSLATAQPRRPNAAVPRDENIRSIPLPEVEDPNQICVEKNRVYISDKRAVLVYDLKKGGLLTKIGKIGQGPGEFAMGPLGLTLFSDKLVVADVRKIKYFSAEGKYLSEVLMPPNMGPYPFLPAGKNFVGFPVEYREDGSPPAAPGWIYNRDLKSIKKFYDSFPVKAPPPPPGKSGAPAIKTDVQMIGAYTDFLVSEDKIYVADSRKGLTISVFDEAGNPLNVIRVPVEKVKVSRSYMDEVIRERQASKYWTTILARQNPIFDEFFPDFAGMKIDGGRISVITAAQRNGLYEVIVLNREGRILERAYRFPLRPEFQTLQFFGRKYDINEDRIFWLVYNEAKELYELHFR